MKVLADSAYQVSVLRVGSGKGSVLPLGTPARRAGLFSRGGAGMVRSADSRKPLLGLTQPPPPAVCASGTWRLR